MGQVSCSQKNSYPQVNDDKLYSISLSSWQTKVSLGSAAVLSWDECSQKTVQYTQTETRLFVHICYFLAFCNQNSVTKDNWSNRLLMLLYTLCTLYTVHNSSAIPTLQNVHKHPSVCSENKHAHLWSLTIICRDLRKSWTDHTTIIPYVSIHSIWI